MRIFTGSGVALITPFLEDGKIHFEELEKMLEDQIAEGTDAIIVCGTTGEPATMTYEEREELIRFTVEQTAHRIPVIAGTGANATETAVKLSKAAARNGVDGLLVVTPFYNKATQTGLYEHYKQIAMSVDAPLIMYNVPSRTGCNILPETAVRIAREIPNVVGIKEASGNIAQVLKIVSLADDCLDVYSGNDDMIVPILSLGGAGVISVLANVAPQEVHNMVMEYRNGNTEEALRLQKKYQGLIEALFCEVNPIPVKWAANLMGYRAGGLRLPLTELEEQHKHYLEQEMKKVRLI